MVMRSATHEVEVIRLVRDRSVQRLRVRTLPDGYLVGYFSDIEKMRAKLGDAAFAALKTVEDR